MHKSEAFQFGSFAVSLSFELLVLTHLTSSILASRVGNLNGEGLVDAMILWS